MNIGLWASAKSATPVDARLVIIGCVCGLAVGAIAIPDWDAARAIGLKVFIACALGSWVAVNLWNLLSRIFWKWSASQTNRIARLQSIYPDIFESASQKEPARPDRLGKLLLAAYPFWISMKAVGMSLLTTQAFLLLIEVGTSGIKYWDLQIGIVIIGVVITAISIFGQSVPFWYTDFRLTKIERHLGNVATAPIGLPDRLNQAAKGPQWWVYKITGVRGPAVEREDLSRTR